MTGGGGRPLPGEQCPRATPLPAPGGGREVRTIAGMRGGGGAHPPATVPQGAVGEGGDDGSAVGTEVPVKVQFLPLLAGAGVREMCIFDT